MIDTALILSSLPFLLRGLFVSLQVALISSVLGIIGGTGVALGQLSAPRVIRAFLFVYVQIIRGTPMLIQILFAYYVLPQWSIPIDPFWTACVVIGMNSSAYISEVMRSGIQSISKGQWEAAYVLGLTHTQTMRFVILPQAIRVVLPALGNEFVTLIKDSSLASVIGVMELTKEGRIIASRTYDSITIFAIVGLLYIIVTWTVSYGIFLIEKRMHFHARS